MDEMLRLIHDNSIAASSVESVEIHASQIEFDNLSQHRPTTGLAGKFSMEFCLAILLLDGKAGLREFSDETVNRADVQEMIKRVQFSVDPKLEESGARILSITLKDGRNISGSTSFAKGSPQNPMSFDEVAGKFRECARFAGWPEQKMEAIVKATSSLDSADNLTALASLLTAQKS
jgi:2-methylcitrate dehydratase PrpD